MEERIERKPNVFNGQPYIKGKDITVSQILELLKEGKTQEDITRCYANLTKEDIKACLDYIDSLVKVTPGTFHHGEPVEIAEGPVEQLLLSRFPSGLSSWWSLKWLLSCGFFSYLAINLIIGLPRMWQKSTFSLFSVGPFSVLGGEHRLEDEILIQTAIAGLTAGIGSVIFCMKELFEMWEKEATSRKFAPLLPRPFFGILLAIIFFFIVKAGMVSIAGTALESKAPEAIDAARVTAAAIGGLVGMFAEEAMFRLKAVAKALFMPETK